MTHAVCPRMSRRERQMVNPRPSRVGVLLASLLVTDWLSPAPYKGYEENLIMPRLTLVCIVVALVVACLALTMLSYLEMLLSFPGRALRKVLA